MLRSVWLRLLQPLTCVEGASLLDLIEILPLLPLLLLLPTFVGCAGYLQGIASDHETSGLEVGRGSRTGKLKLIGGVATTTCYITTAPPGIQVGPNRVEIQGHFKYLGSITQGNGGHDREIQSRINAASQVFRSLK